MSGNTGFTPAQKRTIRDRDGGCIVHTENYAPLPYLCLGKLTEHHRKNRGNGSVQSRNRVANGMLVCAQVNQAFESDPDFAEYARDKGWKLRSDFQIEETGIWVPRLQRFVWLDDEGSYLSQPYGSLVEVTR